MTNEKFQELLQKAIKICSDCGYDTKNINKVLNDAYDVVR